jgi:hypothetical protein
MARTFVARRRASNGESGQNARVNETPANPQPVVPHPAGAVSAIRAARQWPVFQPNKRANFWINSLLTIVALAASYGAALGQAGFAEIYLGMHGPERFVVFLIIEATAVALMMLANQTALAGDSAGGLWTLVWLVTAGAVTMQVLHAYAIGKPEAAMVYATASVLTVVLWRAKTRRSLRDRLRAAGMIEDPLPRYRPVRWVLRPRETFRAWYLALGEGVSDPATAMDMARADHLYHRSATAARVAVRRARRDRQKPPDLTSQRHVVPPWRVTHPDAARFGVLPWHQHTPAQIASAPPAVRQPTPKPPVQRAPEPVVHDEPLLPAVRPTFSEPAVFEPPTSVPPTTLDGPLQIERPVSAVPELFHELREQLGSTEPQSPPRLHNGTVRGAVFEALDQIIDDVGDFEEGVNEGVIIGGLVDRFPNVDDNQLMTLLREYRRDYPRGRRRRRASVA